MSNKQPEVNATAEDRHFIVITSPKVNHYVFVTTNNILSDVFVQVCSNVTHR